MLKKQSIFGLIALAFIVTACSAKDAEAKIVAATSVDEATVSAKTAAETKRPPPSEQFALLFEKVEEETKQALVNNPKNFQDKVNFDAYPAALGKALPEKDKIEVIEFFSYGCGACFQAEATMHALGKNLGEDVNFIRIPAAFNDYFEHLARGYYAAMALGAAPEAHNDIFLSIHLAKKRLHTPEALAYFYSQYGVDKEKFLKAYSSFSIDTSIKRSAELATKYQINAVPNVVVNGKYLSTGLKAGSYEKWAQIIGQLVDSERQLANQ